MSSCCKLKGYNSEQTIICPQKAHVLVGSLLSYLRKMYALFQTLKVQNSQLPDNEAITNTTLSKTKLASHGTYLKFSSVGAKHIPIEWFPSLIHWGFAPASSMVPKRTALHEGKYKSVALLSYKTNTEA